MRKLKITKIHDDKKREAQAKNELIQKLKAAYGEIQRFCLSDVPLTELKSVVHISELFKMNVQRAAIFTSVFCINENDTPVTDKLLFGILRKFLSNDKSVFRLEMREMIRLDFFTKSKEGGLHVITLQHKVITALDEGDIAFFENIGPKGLESTMEFVRNKLLDFDVLTENEVSAILGDIEKGNEELALVKYCNDQMFYFAIVNTVALYAICSRAVVDSRSFDFAYMETYFPFGRRTIQALRENILDGSWAPIEDGLVEIDGGNQIEYNPVLRLTALGYDTLLKELDPVLLKSIRTKLGAIKTPLIEPTDIEKVQLHFSPELAERTERIAALLSKESFAKYQSKFPQKAKMKGLTLLFHGGPGCGKTEFAMQLSRITGRPLMKVQVTDFQSKWVGESEAQLKQIFRDYRMACERSEIIPILFLNECDQVIGKRIDVSSSVDQMSNALQNILLEEMENFNGIMLGTTNLARNMDAAFERRWVMKVLFESPNKDAKKAIWKSVIKGLRANEVDTLVDQFDLTPGEIFNISRRFAVEKLLGLKKTKLKTLIELCETERFQSSAVKLNTIGFALDRKAG